VLERARTREVAVLRHVPRHDHRDAVLLGHADEGVGTGPHLRDASRHLGGGWITDRLDGVHRKEERRATSRRSEHGRQVAARREGDPIPRDAEPARSGRDLSMGFLARHEQTRPSRPREAGQQMEEQRRLPDPRLPREKDDRSGHQPAAEHAIQALDPGRHAGFGPGGPSERKDRRSGAGTTADRALDRAPRAATGATPDPLGDLLPTLGAGEDRPVAGHEVRP
jgi:hypothetical protein